MTAVSTTVDGRHNHRKGRSRLGNGKELLPGCDGRSTWARYLRDTYNALLVHVGGADYASVTQAMQCRRVAALEAELVYLESKINRVRSEGGEPDMRDVDLYVRLAAGQRRHAEVIGWRPHQRDITGDVLTYARNTAAELDDSEDSDG